MHASIQPTIDIYDEVTSTQYQMNTATGQEKHSPRTSKQGFQFRVVFICTISYELDKKISSKLQIHD